MITVNLTHPAAGRLTEKGVTAIRHDHPDGVRRALLPRETARPKAATNLGGIA